MHRISLSECVIFVNNSLQCHLLLISFLVFTEYHTRQPNTGSWESLFVSLFCIHNLTATGVNQLRLIHRSWSSDESQFQFRGLMKDLEFKAQKLGIFPKLQPKG
ncbi:hypothetical protein MHBO_002366 [Bonamia ostreae]|uniref:Uncharacterized protein n=1 Tax=Bonamia ostreae TaxID=126728 RepID=A0ABV2AM23_9EUKA